MFDTFIITLAARQLATLHTTNVTLKVLQIQTRPLLPLFFGRWQDHNNTIITITDTMVTGKKG